MSEKITQFMTFVSRWIQGLRAPGAPEIDVPDTIMGRIERAAFMVLSILGFISIPAGWITGAFLRYNPTRIPESIVFGWLLGVLAAFVAALVILFSVAGFICIGDYIVRGDDSDDMEDWMDPIGKFIVEAATRPVSWIYALIAHVPQLRRYRRETQAYLAAKLKAESVWADLNRPDAEDLFAGIDDLSMLEGLLRK